STYQVTDAPYIGQLEEQLSHIRMGGEETATDYCNRARQILATMRMAGVHYSTASYLMHVIKGLTSSYNLLKRLSLAPSTRATLNEDSLTSYILQDGAMQEAEWPSELLAQANYVAPVKQCGRPGDSDDNDANGGRGRSGSLRPHRGRNQPHKENQPTKSSTSAKNADSSAGGKGRDEKEAPCLLVGVVEPIVSLAPEAGEEFKAMAAAGRSTVALQGEAGRQVLIPDVLYVPGVRADLLSAGQLKENGVKLQEDGVRMDVAHLGGWRRPRSGVLHRASPLHRPASLLGEVATGLDLKSVCGADLPCVLCVGGKLAQHTFPDQGSDADDVLAVVHVDLCGPFRVAAMDGHLYFLLLKDRKTRYMWVRQVAKKSDALQEFVQWLVTLQQNGMAEREMRTVVESVQTMLLHMGVQHHWWHLALRQAVWVRNCLERSTLQPGTTPYQLLTGKKPDLSLARVWGCMAQFLVPEQQRGGKLKPKARWGLHLGVSEEIKGWELLDIADNRVVTTLDVVYYENMSLEVWKSEHGSASGWTPTIPPTDTTTATLPLLAKVGEPAAEDVEDVPSPFPSPVPRAPPLMANWRGLTPVSASGDEWRREEQAEEVQPTLEKPAKKAPAGQQPTGEQAAVKPTMKPSATRHSAEEPTTGEKSAGKPAEVQQDDEGSEVGDDGGDADESTDSDVVEVQRGPRQSGRIRRLPNFYVPAAFTTAYDEVDDDLQYDDAEEDEDFSELDPDMHADPEHRWDISTMTMKEALVSWKGKAVKAAMEEEIRSLVGMGTWELVERPPGVNIMKNRWVLTTKYHIDDTIEREKARLVVKGFTKVYGADYNETYAPVSSYVTLRIFLIIVSVLDLNLMQLDMKNAFLQSKLDWVLYKYQPDYFNDGTGRVWKLLKSLYGPKQSSLLWYRALDGVLLSGGWKKSQVDMALYFKVGDDKVTCWVLVYVDDLLAASSSAAMLKELKELLKAAFKLREILPGYADKLRRRFLDEEQNGRTPKTPVLVDAYATITFDDEEAQVHQEEEYRQKVGSLQFAATTTRPDIAFACSKLGSGLNVRSDQHWREVDRCLAYLANTRDTALEFGGGAESLKLVGYVDVDDASDKQNRTSTGGYVFVSGGATYVAATEASKEGRRLRFLLAKFRQLDAGTPTVLRVDNKSAITVAEGMGLTGNLKHMERRQAWLQHMVKRGKFSLRYIPTTEQPADFLTKAFNRCFAAIG
ncbi:unnamed protein product, partial [Closterium sp. NIES-53]